MKRDGIGPPGLERFQRGIQRARGKARIGVEGQDELAMRC